MEKWGAAGIPAGQDGDDRERTIVERGERGDCATQNCDAFILAEFFYRCPAVTLEFTEPSKRHIHTQ
jgi:hypothetical protein